MNLSARSLFRRLYGIIMAAMLAPHALPSSDDVTPRIVEPWWQVAADPDLGNLSTPRQEPVDFAIWQAADGSWQIWSCIRHTAEKGRTRLFFRWQGARITDKDWEPMGVAMRADSAFGETEGGLQAPFVFRHDGRYHMFYGDWRNICRAIGWDGKTFARMLQPNGKSALFTEDPAGQPEVMNNARDVMLLRTGKLWHAYYTAYPNKRGAVYVRTSKDLNHWSASKIVSAGGAAGDGPYSSECPFVYYHKSSRWYFLFKTQRYKDKPQTTVYRSKDPMNFGVNDDRFRVGTLPVAAPEIVEHDGELFIAALLPNLKGIRVARLSFDRK